MHSATEMKIAGLERKPKGKTAKGLKLFGCPSSCHLARELFSVPSTVLAPALVLT